jgi:hypothetical protein
MEIQFSKLGLIPPEGSIPPNIRNTFQLLWANNGDIISKQYAGTNALKVCNADVYSLQNLVLYNTIAVIIHLKLMLDWKILWLNLYWGFFNFRVITHGLERENLPE